MLHPLRAGPLVGITILAILSLSVFWSTTRQMASVESFNYRLKDDFDQKFQYRSVSDSIYFEEARALLEKRGVDFIDGGTPKVIWTFYAGTLSERRAKSLVLLEDYCLKSGLKLIHVNFENIHDFEVAKWHPVFEESLGANEAGLPKLLSGNHISDYFRSYIGYYFGGWYSDVKPIEEGVEIVRYLEDMTAENKYVVGFEEMKADWIGYSEWSAETFEVPRKELFSNFKELISCGSFGSRPGSLIFSRLVDTNDKLLTREESALRQYPAETWRCCQRKRSWSLWRWGSYPIVWADLFGNVIHSLEYLHPEEMHIIRDLSIDNVYDLDNYK